MRMGSLWFEHFQVCWKIDKDDRVIRSTMDVHCLKWEGHVEGIRGGGDHPPKKGYEHQEKREAALVVAGRSQERCQEDRGGWKGW